jgi:hypothetical protein
MHDRVVPLKYADEIFDTKVLWSIFAITWNTTKPEYNLTVGNCNVIYALYVDVLNSS